MIYRKIFINYFKLTFCFFIILLLSSIIYLSLFTSYQAEKSNLIIIYNNLDPNTLSLLKIDILSFDNILYYYIIYLNFAILIYLLYASILAIKTLKDETCYINIFLTLPISKTNYLKKKILLAFINIIILDFLMFIFMLISFSFFKIENYALSSFLLILAISISQITIYALMLALSAFIKNKNTLILASILILLLFLILNAIYKMTNITALAYICPLAYFDYLKIISTHDIEFDYLASMIIITIFGFNLALCEYNLNGVDNNV